MTELSKDPIINVIHNGIKRPIRLLLEAECFPAALILTFSGIDTMASLSMPAGQEEVTQTDFVNWCNRYIYFKGKEQITGLEFYGARCGLLHTHSPFSRLSKQGKVRIVCYADRLEPPVKSNPTLDPNMVIVSIEALVDVFCNGVDNFLIDTIKNSQRAECVNNRFQLLMHTSPYKREGVIQ